MAPAKGSGQTKRALKEEGLSKTDNDLELTSWPQAQMINQKNYYTEYLKRDDQYLAYRTLQEENSHRLRREALDRARNGMQVDQNGTQMDIDVPMDDSADGANGLTEPHGAKIIVIHPGSQNLRIGLANDALPKEIPMCIARKSKQSESEENGGEPAPKRLKLDDGELDDNPQKWFGEDFKAKYDGMAVRLKTEMRNNKRRLLPNSKELVINWGRRATYEEITEHNDPHRIEWTEIPRGKAPDYFVGHEALRIPDNSRPRYRLTWPLRLGWFNEQDYTQKNLLLNDIFLIIEEAIKTQLGVPKQDLADYGCVFVIPDLYERQYVTLMLDGLMREFGFKKACFMQESLAASFGAGYSIACVVDIGAQKTSVCCVEDGMCIEDSRMNLKFGGRDVTELFIKMMLFDYFPYSDINLKRRYDYLLAEELKQKFCTMNEAEISVQVYDFHLRAAGQNTRKYVFKTYDEPMLAPMGYFLPDVFDHLTKLHRRHTVIDRSYDLYDGTPNDPWSPAQGAALNYTTTIVPSAVQPAPPSELLAPQPQAAATPSKPKSFPPLSRLQGETDGDSTPRSSLAGSPVPEAPTPEARDSPGPPGSSANGTAATAPSADGGPVQPAPTAAAAPALDRATETHLLAQQRSRILPLMPLHHAILCSIQHACRLPTNLPDDRKMRDFLGSIMLVGGGAKTPLFQAYLELKLRELMPGFGKEIIIGLPPREMDMSVVGWKGGSVFARLSASGNDSWIWRREWDVLGAKLLAQKCMWNW